MPTEADYREVAAALKGRPETTAADVLSFIREDAALPDYLYFDTAEKRKRALETAHDIGTEIAIPIVAQIPQVTGRAIRRGGEFLEEHPITADILRAVPFSPVPPAALFSPAEIQQFGGNVQALGRTIEETQRLAQSEQWRQAQAEPLYQRDPKTGQLQAGPGLKNPLKIAGTVANAIGSSLPLAAAGGTLIPALAKAGLSAELAGIVVMALGEGIYSGGLDAIDTEDAFMSIPTLQLAKTPEFRATLATAPEQLDQNQKMDWAKRRMARKMGDITFAAVTPVTAAAGAPLGAAFGRLMAGKGATSLAANLFEVQFGEWIQETGQSTGETLVQNYLFKRYIDPKSKLTAGLLENLTASTIGTVGSTFVLGGMGSSVNARKTLEQHILDIVNNSKIKSIPDNQVGGLLAIGSVVAAQGRTGPKGTSDEDLDVARQEVAQTGRFSNQDGQLNDALHTVVGETKLRIKDKDNRIQNLESVPEKNRNKKQKQNLESYKQDKAGLESALLDSEVIRKLPMYESMLQHFGKDEGQKAKIIQDLRNELKVFPEQHPVNIAIRSLIERHTGPAGETEAKPGVKEVVAEAPAVPAAQQKGAQYGQEREGGVGREVGERQELGGPLPKRIGGEEKAGSGRDVQAHEAKTPLGKIQALVAASPELAAGLHYVPSIIEDMAKLELHPQKDISQDLVEAFERVTASKGRKPKGRIDPDVRRLSNYIVESAATPNKMAAALSNLNLWLHSEVKSGKQKVNKGQIVDKLGELLAVPAVSAATKAELDEVFGPEGETGGQPYFRPGDTKPESPGPAAASKPVDIAGTLEELFNDPRFDVESIDPELAAPEPFRLEPALHGIYNLESLAKLLKHVQDDPNFKKWNRGSKTNTLVFHGSTAPNILALDPERLFGHHGFGFPYFAQDPIESDTYVGLGGDLYPSIVKMENPFDLSRNIRLDEASKFLELVAPKYLTLSDKQVLILEFGEKVHQPKGLTYDDVYVATTNVAEVVIEKRNLEGEKNPSNEIADHLKTLGHDGLVVRTGTKDRPYVFVPFSVNAVWSIYLNREWSKEGKEGQRDKVSNRRGTTGPPRPGVNGVYAEAASVAEEEKGKLVAGGLGAQGRLLPGGEGGDVATLAGYEPGRTGGVGAETRPLQSGRERDAAEIERLSNAAIRQLGEATKRIPVARGIERRAGAAQIGEPEPVFRTGTAEVSAQDRETRLALTRAIASSVRVNHLVPAGIEVMWNAADVVARHPGVEGWLRGHENVKAVYIPGPNPAIIILAENATSQDDVVLSVVHELFGHFAPEVVLGKDANRFYTQLFWSRNRECRAVARRLGIDLSNRKTVAKNQAWAAREYLAEQVQNGNYLSPGLRSWWGRFTRMFKDGLRKLGFDGVWVNKLTDAEIAGIVTLGAQRVTEGAPTAVETQADIALYARLESGLKAQAIGANAIGISGDPAVIEDRAKALGGYRFNDNTWVFPSYQRPDLQREFGLEDADFESTPAELQDEQEQLKQQYLDSVPAEQREQVKLAYEKEATNIDKELNRNAYLDSAMALLKAGVNWVKMTPEEFQRKYGVAGEKEDFNRFWKYLGSQEFYYDRVPAAERTFNAAMRKQDDLYHYIHHLVFNDQGQDLIKPLEKLNKQDFQYLTDFFVWADQNNVPIKAQRKRLKRDGMRDNKALMDAWRGYRIILDKALKLYQDYLMEKEQELKKLPQTKELHDEILNIRNAIKEMEALKGSYAPRFRQEGGYILGAAKQGEHPQELFFKTKYDAEYRAERLQEQNYDVTKVYKGTPQYDQDARTSVLAVEKVVLTALQRFEARMVKAEQLHEGEKGPALLQHGDLFDHNDIVNVLEEQLANTFRAVGMGSLRIHRGPETGLDVKIGYETNPLLNIREYVQRVSNGLAKARAADAMMRAFTGTDIEFDPKRHVNPETGQPDYGQYVREVRERRIDPAKQSRAYEDVKTFMDWILRDKTPVDRVFGIIKSLAVVNYIGTRYLSAPVVNMTALTVAYPAVANGELGMPFLTAHRYIGKGMDAYSSFRYGQGKSKAITDDVQYALLKMKDLGWDNAQFRDEAVAALQGQLGRGWTQFINATMLTFSHSESLNRGSTILATYMWLKEQSIRKGTVFDRDAALAESKRISDKTHAQYGDIAQPYLGRQGGPTARVFQSSYIFGKFSHNYLNNMVDYGFHKKQVKPFLWLLLWPGVIAGRKGIVGSTIALGLLRAFGAGDLEDKLFDWLYGKSAHAATFVRQGLAGLAGIDISGSLAIDLWGVPKDLKELIGVTGSLIEDKIKAGKLLSMGFVREAAEAVVPRGVASLLRARREQLYGYRTSRFEPVFLEGKPMVPTTGEIVARALGFNPARPARVQDERWQKVLMVNDAKQQRNDVILRINHFGMKAGNNDFKTNEEAYRVFNKAVLPYFMAFNQYIIEKGLDKRGVKPIENWEIVEALGPKSPKYQTNLTKEHYERHDDVYKTVLFEFKRRAVNDTVKILKDALKGGQMDQDSLNAYIDKNLPILELYYSPNQLLRLRVGKEPRNPDKGEFSPPLKAVEQRLEQLTDEITMIEQYGSTRPEFYLTNDGNTYKYPDSAALKAKQAAAEIKGIKIEIIEDPRGRGGFVGWDPGWEQGKIPEGEKQLTLDRLYDMVDQQRDAFSKMVPAEPQKEE